MYELQARTRLKTNNRVSKFITGKDRCQTEFFCLEQAVSQDNEVRLIDLFIGTIKLSDFGFKMDFIENGRPAYHPSDLLKLFIYGYLNRIRSSRALEKECKRNIELMWLMRGLSPDHNTIANFRKDNPKAIRSVFRSTVALAKNFNLIGGTLIAGDSTKLRAQNSKKNNFNPLKIERHIAYIDAKLNEYNSVLASEDKDAVDDNKRIEIQKKVNKHQQQRKKYEHMQKTLEESAETQISTSDPDSRQMITRNNITEVAYNVQSTVDAKHNIPIDFKVTNQNDSKAMGTMVRRAKTILGKSDFTALYDKGYHTGTEFNYAHKQGVEVVVAAPDVASHAPDVAFDVAHFDYNKELDEYTCPAQEKLTTNSRWYNKASGKTINRVKHYKTKACLSCALFARCTKNKAGRLIERSEHMDLIEANKRRLSQNMALYRKRQAIVEHPFGIIKRQWGFYYIMTKKSIKHASADVGLIFTAYNLRRILNLIDKNQLKEYLKSTAYFVFIIRTYFKSIRRTINFRITENSIAIQYQSNALNRLYLTLNQFDLMPKMGF
jgi:transposase